MKGGLTALLGWKKITASKPGGDACNLLSAAEQVLDSFGNPADE